MAEPKTTHSSDDGQFERRVSVAAADLSQNTNGNIKNQLAGIPHATLIRLVSEFAQQYNLAEHTLILQKGALVGQSPNDYHVGEGTAQALTDREVTVLRDEILHKWRHPWKLYLTILTCSIGAAVQGWDQTGSNGANLSFPTVFGIAEDTTRDTFIVGLVNAAPYLASAVIGCWLSDPINFHVGRRGTIFIAAIFCFLPVLGSAFTQTWEQLFACRFLLGLGMGLKGSTVPIFAAENSPAAIRGALVMSWQLWTALGIFLGTCANLAMVNVGKYAWRYQLGSAIIPAIPLLFLIYTCPESPRWLMKKGKYQQALKNLTVLRNDPIQAARDLYMIHTQIEIDRQIVGDSNVVTRFIELFTIPRIRRATLASFTVMIAQQMCGINIIAFYSSTIFKNSGFTDYQALWASFGFGLINFLFAFPALWTIDTFGRRSLLLFTFPNMAWTLLAAGLCALIPVENTAHLALVALFVYLFAMFYSPGEGPVPFAYSAEVFPLSHREVGMAWAVATCLFWATVLTLFLPLMLSAMGTTGVFGFYAGTNIIALIMIFLFVPETKQRTLEELDYVFGVPTSVHIKYQLTEALPWWFNRWVLMRKGTTLRPLYTFPDSHIEPSRTPDVVENEKY